MVILRVAPKVPPAVNQLQRWCISTGERSMLQKSGKNDIADSEFCEGRRKISVNERNNLFFVGSGIPDKNGMIPVVLPQIIRRSAVL